MEDRIEHERSEQRPNLPASTVGCGNGEPHSIQCHTMSQQLYFAAPNSDRSWLHRSALTLFSCPSSCHFSLSCRATAATGFFFSFFSFNTSREATTYEKRRLSPHLSAREVELKKLCKPPDGKEVWHGVQCR